jgi:hypothetical protein
MYKIVIIWIVAMLSMACSSGVSGGNSPSEDSIEQVEKDASILDAKLKLELVSEENLKDGKRLKFSIFLDNTEVNMSGMEIKIEYSNTNMKAIRTGNEIENILCFETEHQDILMNYDKIIINNSIEKEGFLLLYSLENPDKLNGNLGEFYIEVEGTVNSKIEISELKVTEITDEGQIISYDNFPKENYIIEGE